MRVLVSGHGGMLGSAITRALRKRQNVELILRSRREVDLTSQSAVTAMFAAEQPDVVILTAARVGGIQANMSDPTGFLLENLMIQNNVIHQANASGVKQFCFLGSSCIYPRECPQPMKEEYLLTGPPEPTNEAYALAKIAGLKLVEYMRRQYGFPGFTLVPCNLYGTNDSFDPNHSHVLSALVKKFVDAADAGDPFVTIWGTGRARREFMHVDDAAEATLHFLDSPTDLSYINVGWGEDVSIRELAELVARLSGFGGEMRWNSSKPDGMPRKCMDVSRMFAAGFRPAITLEEGVRRTIAEYRTLCTSQPPSPR